MTFLLPILFQSLWKHTCLPLAYMCSRYKCNALKAMTWTDFPPQQHKGSNKRKYEFSQHSYLLISARKHLLCGFCIQEARRIRKKSKVKWIFSPPKNASCCYPICLHFSNKHNLKSILK